MEWSWNDQFHMDSIWNAGIFTLDSMEQIQFHGNPAGISEKEPYLITKNSGNIKNQTPGSTASHMINQMSTPSTALCNCSKVRM